MNFHPVRNPSRNAHLWFDFHDIWLKRAAWGKKNEQTFPLKQAVLLFTMREWGKPKLQVMLHKKCILSPPLQWCECHMSKTPMAECLYSSVFLVVVLVFCLLHKPHFWPFCFLKDPDDDKHLNLPRTWIDKHSHKDMKVCYLKHDCGRGSIMWHGAAYVNICLAEGVYSLSYLKKQIISGWAPLPCGTCSSFTEIILSAGRGSGVGSDKKEGEESVHHVKFPLNVFNFKIF